MFYTLFASLPIIISLFYCYILIGSLDFYFLFESIDSVFLFFCINFVFFIKAPIFLVHLWLPKAHVEAPVSGSIILAGVILKLGGYGIIRLFILFSIVGISVGVIFLTIRLIGGLMVSFICMRQRDIKSLIAYSSVRHMRLVLGGIFSFGY